MTAAAPPVTVSAREPARRARTLAAAALPVALLVALAGALVAFDPASTLANGAPAAEDVAVERVVLTQGEIAVHVRNAAPDNVIISQVLVDDAYWQHEITPDPFLEPNSRAVIRLAYPWVEGEAHEVVMITATGATFAAEVPVAVASPAPGAFLVPGILIGLLVGVLPVAAGATTLPALRGASVRVRAFTLAFTVGLLAFLGADAAFEAFEIADEIAASLNGAGLVLVAGVTAVLGVLLAERVAHGRAERAGIATPARRALTLAYLVAFAIGVHNLGEGLAIAGAYTAGELGLGAALFIGFAVHNVTEGPAIVAPLARAGWSWQRLLAHGAALVALAGLPTILGAWLGGLALTPAYAAAALGFGAGAAFVVVGQVWTSLRGAEGADDAGTRGVVLAGLLVGVLVMYATGLLA